MRPHLDADELARWSAEGRAEERDRVVGHVAACAECSASLAELARTRPAELSTSRFDPAEYSRAGARALRRRGLWNALGRSLPLRLAAAGLAALALGAFLLGRSPAPIPTGEVAPRGPELVLLSPPAQAGWPVEFRWASPVTASRYQVDIFAADGARVHSMQTPREEVTDEGLRALLQPGTRYEWTVTALAKDGRALMTSGRESFVFVEAR